MHPSPRYSIGANSRTQGSCTIVPVHDWHFATDFSHRLLDHPQRRRRNYHTILKNALPDGCGDGGPPSAFSSRIAVSRPPRLPLLFQPVSPLARRRPPRRVASIHDYRRVMDRKEACEQCEDGEPLKISRARPGQFECVVIVNWHR
jgi:hypothetical protein